MQIEKIKNRGILFSNNTPGWNYNIYLLMGSKCNYLIDTGLGSLSTEPVKEYIKNTGNKTIVINTHYHWDHVFGNSSFDDSTIISHRLCRELIVSNWDAMLERKGMYCNGIVQKRLPDLVFDRELYFPDDGLRLFYSPGHTEDSISVLDEQEKILIAGDNIGDSEEDIIPGLDCEKAVYMDTLQKYAGLDFDLCLSGHCSVLKKDAINQIIASV